MRKNIILSLLLSLMAAVIITTGCLGPKEIDYTTIPPDTLLLMGHEAIVKGDWEKARGALRQALVTLPDNGDAHYELGLAYKNLGQDGLALIEFQDAYKILGDQTKVLLELADALVKANKWYDARPILEKVASTKGKEPDFILNMAKAYEAGTDGENWTEGADTNKALDFYEKALKKYPDDLNILYKLGDIYRMKHDTDKSIEILKQVVRKDSTKVDAVMALAEAYVANSQYYLAIKKYQQLYEQNPNNPKLLNKMAEAYYMKKEYDNAEMYYLKCYDLDPTNVDVLYYLGSLNELKGTVEGLQAAADYYEKAIQYKPNDKDVLYNLGELNYNLGEYGKALDFYKRVVELDPTNVEAWNSIGLCDITIGNELLGMGDTEGGTAKLQEAIAAFDKCIEIDDFYAMAVLNKAIVMEALGYEKEASMLYEQAYEMDPTLFE